MEIINIDNMGVSPHCFALFGVIILLNDCFYHMATRSTNITKALNTYTLETAGDCKPSLSPRTKLIKMSHDDEPTSFRYQN